MSFLKDRKGTFSLALKRGNIILPNIITILGLLCGLYSMIASMRGNFVFAAYLLMLAALFDALDGKVARLVKGTSEFGVQLDSLCDLVSFGVAPAVLVYMWVLVPFGRISTMAVFLFVACGALRLARFNVQSGKISSTYFVGLPIPGAAAFIASSVLFVRALDLDISRFALAVFFLVSIYILAFLMVSTIPFFSFKKVSYFKEHPFNALVIFVLIICAFILKYDVLFFAFVFLYIFISVLLALFRFLRNNKQHYEAGDASSADKKEDQA